LPTTDTISLVGERVSFLPPPPSDAPAFELSIDHIVSQHQLQACGLQSLAGHTWRVSLSELVDDLTGVILSADIDGMGT